jgi:hypothetical protein
VATGRKGQDGQDASLQKSFHQMLWVTQLRDDAGQLLLASDSPSVLAHCLGFMRENPFGITNSGYHGNMNLYRLQVRIRISVSQAHGSNLVPLVFQGSFPPEDIGQISAATRRSAWLRGAYNRIKEVEKNIFAGKGVNDDAEHNDNGSEGRRCGA